MHPQHLLHEHRATPPTRADPVAALGRVCTWPEWLAPRRFGPGARGQV